MSDTSLSGRFVLRLPPALHALLRAAAAEAGLSLNEYCVRQLAAPTVGRTHQGLTTVIERAASVAGPHLVGVVVFGSWARGQAADSSDIDVLVVVDPVFPLTRAVYRAWDDSPLNVDHRSVEMHIVRLPERHAGVTGVWAEVALDGIVLFERGIELSTYLSRVRRAILAGKLVQKTIHGQPYWHEVA